MTKRKTTYLWGILLLFFVTVNSCRNDFLQENQVREQGQISGMTSKIISINQSKHREKLLNQLKKSKTELNKSSLKNAVAKSVSYGDSITINTDKVIYIENGNYHTYTFNIQRNNSSPNDPVENLLLAPLPDGNYKEFLVTYNLTKQEKEDIRNGHYFYLGKYTTVKELAAGTFNGGHQLARQSCGWETRTGWNKCSSGHHDGSNFMDCDYLYNMSNGNYPPTTYTYSVYVCAQNETLAPSDPPSSGGGGGGGGGTPCDDCPPPADPTECVQAPNDPTQPTTGIADDGGCIIGTPTLPNLGDIQTPCQKIKTQRNDEEFKKRMDTLQSKTGLQKETGYIQKWGGDYDYKDNATATPTANSLSLPEVATNNFVKAFMHTHVDNYDFVDPTDGETKTRIGIKNFSPADVGYFMDLVQNAQTNGHPLGDVYGVMVSSSVNYQIRFTGNQYQIKTFTDEQIKVHKDPYTKYMESFIGKQKKLEFGLLKYMDEKMNLKGITLYRMNDDGTTTEIKLNADKTDTTETTCSNK